MIVAAVAAVTAAVGLLAVGLCLCRVAAAADRAAADAARMDAQDAEALTVANQPHTGGDDPFTVVPVAAGSTIRFDRTTSPDWYDDDFDEWERSLGGTTR